MRVEREDVTVCLSDTPERGSLADEVLKQRLHTAVAFQDEAFRMPLHAHGGLLFRTLYGLDNAVGRAGRHPEVWSRVCHCLVVERVHRNDISEQPGHQ